jgi:redox-sensitive bicupin YhaK (pirin superfamily)
MTIMDTKSTVVRTLERIIEAVNTSDGAGVKLRRSLGRGHASRVDPFLMLDEFSSENPDDYVAGFPPHPHRGFETVTYMLEGHMRHEDHLGNRGELKTGGVQWMTAGRGVIHSEIPQQQAGRMEGFQLWLNLPGRDKLCEPWYRDFAAADLPRAQTDQGVTVIVIAGDSHGVTGAVRREATAPLYLDLHLPAGAGFEQALPAGHNAFVYVYRGELAIAGQAVPAGRMALLANEADADGVVLHAGGEARALLIAGQPLHEPIAQYGPFVMNSAAEIHQALADYRDGRLG